MFPRLPVSLIDSLAADYSVKIRTGIPFAPTAMNGGCSGTSVHSFTAHVMLPPYTRRLAMLRPKRPKYMGPNFMDPCFLFDGVPVDGPILTTFSFFSAYGQKSQINHRCITIAWSPLMHAYLPSLQMSPNLVWVSRFSPSQAKGSSPFAFFTSAASHLLFGGEF